MAIREAKRVIDEGVDLPLDRGIDVEEQGRRRAVATEDRREGIAAFTEKREPKWRGR